jgi:hypothetical protein
MPLPIGNHQMGTTISPSLPRICFSTSGFAWPKLCLRILLNREVPEPHKRSGFFAWFGYFAFDSAFCLEKQEEASGHQQLANSVAQNPAVELPRLSQLEGDFNFF